MGRIVSLCSKSGAVTAAVDAFLHPLGYLSVSTSYSLRGIPTGS
jgi:hypothetical protein